MKRKRLYLGMVGALLAGLAALIMAAPASAARGLTPDPHHVRCGAQPINSGTFDCGSVTFTNNTSELVEISGFLVEGDTGDLSPSNAAPGACLAITDLAPGESCFLDVLFFPSQTGHLSLRVTVFAADGTSTTVRFSGRGID